MILQIGGDRTDGQSYDTRLKIVETKAETLDKRIGEPSGGVFPWSQPLGATDAYKRGDRVTHNGRTWVSDIDGNVWEPGVYGWTEVSE